MRPALVVAAITLAVSGASFDANSCEPEPSQPQKQHRAQKKPRARNAAENELNVRQSRKENLEAEQRRDNSPGVSPGFQREFDKYINR